MLEHLIPLGKVCESAQSYLFYLSYSMCVVLSAVTDWRPLSSSRSGTCHQAATSADYLPGNKPYLLLTLSHCPMVRLTRSSLLLDSTVLEIPTCSSMPVHLQETGNKIILQHQTYSTLIHILYSLKQT